MMVLFGAMVIMGIILCLSLWLKVGVRVILGIASVVAVGMYLAITRTEHVQFGPHVDIESWKVGVFCVALFLVEVAVILVVWYILRNRQGA